MEDENPNDIVDVRQIVQENLVADEEAKEARKVDEVKFAEKWSAALVLGPFVPAILALVVVFSGQIVINLNTGTCNFPISSIVSAAIATSYLFLVVYSWVFLGDDIKIVIPRYGINLHVLAPFTSVQWLGAAYGIIGFMSFIVWAVGAATLKLASLCATTSPVLYNYTLFLVCIYWLAFFAVITYLVKNRFVRFISAVSKATALKSAEDEVFNSKWRDIDVNDTHSIPVNAFELLMSSLSLPIGKRKREALVQRFDPDDTGFLKYDAVHEWFLRFLDEMNEGGGGEENDEVDDGEGDGEEDGDNEGTGGAGELKGKGRRGGGGGKGSSRK